jgi:hypothetical protein
MKKERHLDLDEKGEEEEEKEERLRQPQVHRPYLISLLTASSLVCSALRSAETTL